MSVSLAENERWEGDLGHTLQCYLSVGVESTLFRVEWNANTLTAQAVFFGRTYPVSFDFDLITLCEVCEVLQ